MVSEGDVDVGLLLAIVKPSTDATVMVVTVAADVCLLMFGA